MASSRQRTRRRQGASDGNGRSAVDAIPPILGEKGQAVVVAELLHSMAKDRFNVEQRQIANGSGNDDPVPGLQPAPDGHLVTYSERRQILLDAERRLVEANEPIMGEVRSILAKIEDHLA